MHFLPSQWARWQLYTALIIICIKFSLSVEVTYVLCLLAVTWPMHLLRGEDRTLNHPNVWGGQPLCSTSSQILYNYGFLPRGHCLRHKPSYNKAEQYYTIGSNILESEEDNYFNWLSTGPDVWEPVRTAVSFFLWSTDYQKKKKKKENRKFSRQQMAKIDQLECFCLETALPHGETDMTLSPGAASPQPSRMSELNGISESMCSYTPFYRWVNWDPEKRKSRPTSHSELVN